MTWHKHGVEFPDECVDGELSDAAFRTHVEAISWLYRIERADLRIPRQHLRRFTGSPLWEEAVTELLAKAFWREEAGCYVVVHHADVIRQSIAAQQNQRARSKKSSATHRKRKDSDVTADVTGHADRQTDKQLAGGAHNVPPAREEPSRPVIPGNVQVPCSELLGNGRRCAVMTTEQHDGKPYCHEHKEARAA